MVVRIHLRQPFSSAECRVRRAERGRRPTDLVLALTPNSALGSLGGEIASRLAYTQKSRGQNLPGRPLPRGVIRSAPVSDTGGPGAKPGEAATFISTKNKHLKRAEQLRCANIL